MPTKRKLNASTASTPIADTQPKTPVETPSSIAHKTPGDTPQATFSVEEILNDPWTDEQETALFKGMIQWKPTGMHKHFRMLSISQSLQKSGFVMESDHHTRIPGIWAKLGSLYDLDALDEREISHAFNDTDPTDPSESSSFPSFSLPEDEYGELMWDRRLANSGSSSPAALSERDDSEQKSPIPDSSDEVNKKGLGSAKTARGGQRKRGAQAATNRRATVGRGRTRAETKAASATDDDDELSEAPDSVSGSGSESGSGSGSGSTGSGEEDEEAEEEAETEEKKGPKSRTPATRGRGRGGRVNRGRGRGGRKR